MIVKLRRRSGVRGAHVVTQVGRARGGWRDGGVVAVAVCGVLVHGDEDGGSFEQLDLLVLGDEQLGRVLPFGRMLPTR